jgi:hypothetical protein
VNKDLLQAFEDGDCNVILHQCNCTKGMGAGIAKKIAEKYPEVSKFDKNNERLFGSIGIVSLIKGQKAVCNLYSQYFVGSPSDDSFILPESNYRVLDTFENRIVALRHCLTSVRKKVYNHTKIGIPLIASGLAADKKLKGTMTDLEYFKKYIEPIVEEELKDLDVTVYYI